MKIENLWEKYKKNEVDRALKKMNNESDWARWYTYWGMEMPKDDRIDLAIWSTEQDLEDKQDVQWLKKYSRAHF